MVFSNRTLMHMAEVRPGKKEDFMNIHGIGPAKWEKYGQLFLDAITHYCIENAIAHGTVAAKVRNKKEPTIRQKTHPDATLLEKVQEQLKSAVQILEELSSKLESPVKT
jgi:ATP-dependent DNA helicase RecQ